MAYWYDGVRMGLDVGIIKDGLNWMLEMKTDQNVGMIRIRAEQDEMKAEWIHGIDNFVMFGFKLH